MLVTNFPLTGNGNNWEMIDPATGNVVSILAGSEMLYNRGPLERGVDYTINGSAITFLQNAPIDGEIPFATFYRVDALNAPNFQANVPLYGAGNSWAISDSSGNPIPFVGGSEQLYCRGPLRRGTDYTISGNEVTFIQNAPQAGDKLYASLVELSLVNSYCQQSDLEARIGVRMLAQLTNDVANSTTPDSNVVASLIKRADRLIDAEAGQVFEVPFDPTPVTGNCKFIPSVINQISIDYALYEAMARRFGVSGVSKDWQAVKAAADLRLQNVSNELTELDGEPTVLSSESDFVTPTDDALTDFYDLNNPISGFIDQSTGNS